MRAPGCMGGHDLPFIMILTTWNKARVQEGEQVEITGEIGKLVEQGEAEQ